MAMASCLPVSSYRSASSYHSIHKSADRSDTAFDRSYTTFPGSGTASCRKITPPRKTTAFTRLKKSFQARNVASPQSDATAPLSDTAIPTPFLSDREGHSDTILMQDEKTEQAIRDSYNWEDQWYPLYLTKEVPRDAPLGLQVFDKQLVLHYDGNGILRCYEDRCPHRLAKLSEGQVIDGRLECLYHGWQFEGEGQCVKIPQLPKSAKIPRAACVRSFVVHDFQEVVWVWMGSDKSRADTTKIPHFDLFDDPNHIHISSVHALPYDYSILLENLMDPAHIPISHDRTDPVAKRENAQALKFEIVERTSKGFAGKWGPYSKEEMASFLRFQAPCVLSNEINTAEDGAIKKKGIAIFLCRPAGQGKSMLIFRFGNLRDPRKPNFLPIPLWLVHQLQNKVFEEDMGFLASQNEVLMNEKVPTSELYLNLSTSDVFVMEYRKWLDKVGHGMPHYFGHKTISLPSTHAIIEAAPAGLTAAISSSQPPKVVTTLLSGSPFSPNPVNRYFRHVIHCATCRKALHNFLIGQKLLNGLALVCGVVSVALHRSTRLRLCAILVSFLSVIASYACQYGINMLTTNTVRPHRQ